MTDTAQVRLEVESRPESVTLVRRVLVAFAGAAGVSGELLGDIETAVSEACNNVVLHAYPGHSGPLIVSLEVTAKAIAAHVEDHGGGFRRVSARRPSIGIGLPVISALADQAEFGSTDDGGTHVRMQFDSPRTGEVSFRQATAPGSRRPSSGPRAQ